MGELSLELVEAGLAEPDGDFADHAGDGAANAVVVVAVVLDGFGYAGCGFIGGAAGGHEGVDGVAVDFADQVEELRVCSGCRMFAARREEVFVSDRGDKGNDFDAVREAQVLFGDATGGDAACHVRLQVQSCFFAKRSPIVSRALLRPPPLLALTPYFSR